MELIIVNMALSNFRIFDTAMNHFNLKKGTMHIVYEAEWNVDDEHPARKFIMNTPMDARSKFCTFDLFETNQLISSECYKS